MIRNPKSVKKIEITDARYISVDKIYTQNKNDLHCKGCGALIEGGNGCCPFCERRYGT
jgi:rubrerythrin